ncbi:hypothetical protein LDENG_00017740 [Lucifuga dentata]|nr:hypothetical protein LDENG_00017740 [Lucifuga dentata]
MVWGCMSSSGGELQFIDGIMNANSYCQILEEKMLPSVRRLGRGLRFQHDNDLKHSAKKISNILKRKKVKVLDWPIMSPDLNPIDLWNALKRKVEQLQPSNLSNLTEMTAKRANISLTTCADLVHSMPRCQDVYKLFWQTMVDLQNITIFGKGCTYL